MSENGSSTWIRWIVPGILALVSTVCLIGGGILWGAGISAWIRDAYVFHGWGMIDWLVGILGAAGIAAGLFAGGFFFRFVPWRHAALGSLCLAIVSTAFLIATFAIFSQTGQDDSNLAVVILQVLCIAGIIVLALPPFLHWLRATPGAPETLPAEKKGLAS